MDMLFTVCNIIQVSYSCVYPICSGLGSCFDYSVELNVPGFFFFSFPAEVMILLIFHHLSSLNFFFELVPLIFSKCFDDGFVAFSTLKYRVTGAQICVTWVILMLKTHLMFINVVVVHSMCHY